MNLIEHEIYFEQNLYFSLTKVVCYLENLAFSVYLYYTAKLHSVRPSSLNIKKNIVRTSLA